MTGCARNGCNRQATHHLEARVWAMGRPRIEHQAARMVVGLPLCKRHAREASAEGVFTDESWAHVVQAFLSLRQEAPDRASLVFLPVKGLTDPNTWTTREAMQ